MVALYIACNIYIYVERTRFSILCVTDILSFRKYQFDAKDVTLTYFQFVKNLNDLHQTFH